MARHPDYSDVEAMLFRGFLTLPAELNGVPVVFKTLNTQEHDLTELYTSFTDAEDSEKQRTAYFLAYSVFLFNRINILADREAYLPMLVDEFLDLPKYLTELLLRRLSRLNHRATETIEKIEAYSFGASSRQNWYAYRGCTLNDQRVTGICGTENLGVNYHQKLWIFHNTTEDIQQEYERDRELAKFQASVHAPKGIKRIDAKDRDRRRKDERRKESLYMGEGKSAVTSEGPNGEIKVSDESVDDLLVQMKRSIEGQKDFHDHVIEAHEARIRAQYEAERQQRRARREEARKRREAQLDGVRSKDPFLFYDEEEVQEKVAQQQRRKSEHIREGRYRSHAAFEQRGEHLSKWQIIDDEQEQTPSKKSDSPFAGTVLEDHYRVVEEDVSRPDDLDYPDLLDDE